MTVVVDAVLRFQFLDVTELAPGMRAGDAVAERLAGVQQDFLETAGQAHPLVLGQVLQQGGETLLHAHRHIHALDLDTGPSAVDVMPESEEVPRQIPDRVVAQSVRPVPRRAHGLAIGVLVWSVAAMAHSFATTVLSFALARFLLGLGEATNFPACVTAVAEWFPKRQRSLAT